MLKCTLPVFFVLCSLFSYAQPNIDKELNNFWRFAEKTVADGNFDGYAKTFASDAVLVSDIKQTSYPIAKAFARWKPGFEETKAGKIKASVSFKFTDSFVSDTTAHQTGYFNYQTQDKSGRKTQFIAKFEALLVKQNGQWAIVMERHMKQVSEQEWHALN